ncbi:MAG: tyramine oxidase, partial [Dehalococcoidia bacterium]
MQSTQPQSARAPIRHPLDPLTGSEIESAIAILQSQRSLGEKVRFESIVLNEPSKDLVLSSNGRDAIGREAFIVLFENETGATYEAVVSLGEGEVKSYRHIPGVQPRITMDEFYECELAVKESP